MKQNYCIFVCTYKCNHIKYEFVYATPNRESATGTAGVYWMWHLSINSTWWDNKTNNSRNHHRCCLTINNVKKNTPKSISWKSPCCSGNDVGWEEHIWKTYYHIGRKHPGPPHSLFYHKQQEAKGHGPFTEAQIHNILYSITNNTKHRPLALYWDSGPPHSLFYHKQHEAKGH